MIFTRSYFGCCLAKDYIYVAGGLSIENSKYNNNMNNRNKKILN